MTELEARARLEEMAESMRRISAALGLDDMSDAERAAAAVTTSFMVDGLHDLAEYVASLAPRVLTLEEMQTVDGAGYVEYSANGSMPAVLFDTLLLKLPGGNMVRAVEHEACPFRLDLDDYGKDWRVWNRIPTLAQREAEPWTKR